MKFGDKNPLSFQIDYDKVFRKASSKEKNSEILYRPSTSFFKDAFRRFRKNKVAVVCAIIIIIIILAVAIIPAVYPYAYDQQLGISYGRVDPTYSNLRPFQYGLTEQEEMAQGKFIWPHIFGTDSHGRDYFIRVVVGTQISLLVGIFAAIIVLIIGTIYGSIAGYKGGKVDTVMMRVVDVIYSLPDMVIIILLSVVLKQALNLEGTIFASIGTPMISIFIVFALLYWAGMARLVRGQILSIKQTEFIMASRSIGAKPAFIIRKHLIPNCTSVIVVGAALQIPAAIFTESYLSFLGLGVSIPTPSLGSLANEGLSTLSTRPWELLIPALTIFIVVLSLNLLGDGLRDAFDPKQK